MAVSYSEVLYLGNFADADPDENSMQVDNASTYLVTFGSASTPLFHQDLVVAYDDPNNNGIGTNNPQSTTDNISYDLGAGTVTTQVDSLEVANVYVVYMDGSTGTFDNVVLYQDVLGNLFLTNSNFAGTDLNRPGSGGIQAINVNSISGQAYTGLYQNALQSFVCFAAGTMVRTSEGDRRVDQIQIGDLVETLDNGAQPVRWVGVQNVALTDKLCPVKIRAGALGANLPSSDLMVSQQHRMLVSSKVVPRMFGTNEVLVSAKSLIGIDGIEICKDLKAITYCHILFEEHQVVFANDAPTESLLPGPQAMALMGDEAKSELVAIFPTFVSPRSRKKPARTIPLGKKQRKLAERHQKNALALVGHLPATAARSSQTAS